MHLYHLINLYDEAYGKKHESMTLGVYLNFVFAKIRYGEEESVMIRVWVHTDSNDICRPVEEREYCWTVWKDAIFSNDFLMPEKEKLSHVYEAAKKLCDCEADWLAGKFEIDVPDNKMLRILYRNNRSHMLQYMKDIKDYDQLGRKDYKSSYDDAIRYLPFHIEMEAYLGRLIEKRGLQE